MGRLKTERETNCKMSSLPDRTGRKEPSICHQVARLFILAITDEKLALDKHIWGQRNTKIDKRNKA